MASALYPATGDCDRPTAVVLVDQDDWATAIAAAVLSGRPIGAPILLTDGSELPAVTQDVLDRLKPKGSDLSKDAQVIRVGPGTARPEGYKTALIEGDNPFQRGRGDRPLLLRRARQALERRGALLRRAGRVRDAGRGLGRPLRRRRAAGAAQHDPARRS